MKSIILNTQIGTLAANLYLPQEIKQTLPVVIVTGAWTTVKEQMPAVYAEALTKQGFAAITFDFRGWGQSLDEVKYLEEPARKIEDIRAVIDSLAQREDIDGSNIFGLGICASSGYMLDAVESNPHIRAAAAVAPWLHNADLANAIYGGEASVQNLIQLSEDAAHGEQAVYIEAASTTNQNALMYQAPYYTEANRGQVAQYDNLFNVASWKGWLTYDAVSGAADQDKPILLVASEDMALSDGTHQYLENAKDNVSAIWLEGVSQFDFYDVPEHVEKATQAVAQHFRSHIK